MNECGINTSNYAMSVEGCKPFTKEDGRQVYCPTLGTHEAGRIKITDRTANLFASRSASINCCDDRARMPTDTHTQNWQKNTELRLLIISMSALHAHFIQCHKDDDK